MKTAAENDEVRFINENPKKEKKVRAQLDEWCKREGIDRELLIKAILKAKPKSDSKHSG